MTATSGPRVPEPGGSPLRLAVELTVRIGLQVVDTAAGLVESLGRVSSVEFVERLGAAQGRLLRRTGEAWAEECRGLLR